MKQWILPLGLIVFALVSGLVVEKFLSDKLRKFINAKQIPSVDIILQSLHRTTLLWFGIAGFYGAILISGSGITGDVKAFLEKILTILFLYSATLVLARLAAGFVNLLISRKVGVPTSLISNLAKIAVLILGTLILLQTVGIQVTPIVTTLGVGGLAVGLALQDTLANLFAGFYLIISRQVRTGDYLKLDGGYEGYVTDINWRNTSIKEFSNNVIIVPNSRLSSAIFTNYHLPVKEITLTLDIGVDYNSDLEHVEQVTVEVAKEVMAEIAPELIDIEPNIRFHTFNDFSIDFRLYMRVNEYFDQRIAKHLLIKKLHKRYQEENIQIPFPIRDIYLHN